MCIYFSLYIYIYTLVLLLFFVPVRACNNKFSLHLMSSKHSVHPPSIPLPLLPHTLLRHLRCSLSTCSARHSSAHTHAHSRLLHSFSCTHTRAHHVYAQWTDLSPRRATATAIFLRFSCSCTALMQLQLHLLSLARTCLWVHRSERVGVGVGLVRKFVAAAFS